MKHFLSLSYGKDSLASIEACKQLGYPIDRIIHADVWATDDIPADLPPMTEFKKKADAIIKEKYGITVDHICNVHDGKKVTYERYFYRDHYNKKKNVNEIYGFPSKWVPWCTLLLKQEALRYVASQYDAVQYLGIAADEPERIKKFDPPRYVMPLVDIGWDEEYCRQWCEENDLLSPIYNEARLRGGCWFCHNARVDELRQLYHEYPELWQLLIKWDSDSPRNYQTKGRTIHGYDVRFKAEDAGEISVDAPFRWKRLNTILSDQDNSAPLQSLLEAKDKHNTERLMEKAARLRAESLADEYDDYEDDDEYFDEEE